jgi:hypothetical protein
MKKILCWVMVFAVLTPAVVRAEEAAPAGDAPVMTQAVPEAAAQMEAGTQGCECCKMCQKEGCKCCAACQKNGDCMRSRKCDKMGKSSMVATQDGGVIVLVMNKLQKYDADLNLVKEVEIKMPAMDKKQCPMMGMMGKPAPVPAEAAPAAEVAPAAAPEEQTPAEEAKSPDDMLVPQTI